MGQVAPTFGTPITTEDSVLNTWGINGDTPRWIRVFDPADQYATGIDFDLQQQVVNTYQWSGLKSGVEYQFFVACVYPDGNTLRNGFFATTPGAKAAEPAPEDPPLPVSDFRAELMSPTRIGLRWTQVTMTDPRVVELGIWRTSPDEKLLLRVDLRHGGSDPGQAIDDDVTHGQRYEYVIRAYVPGGHYSEVRTHTVASMGKQIATGGPTLHLPPKTLGLEAGDND
ncbi:MAG: hypothetical protein ACRDT1_07440 [Micromonosporaceae bacterium]